LRPAGELAHVDAVAVVDVGKPATPGGHRRHQRRPVDGHDRLRPRRGVPQADAAVEAAGEQEGLARKPERGDPTVLPAQAAPPPGPPLRTVRSPPPLASAPPRGDHATTRTAPSWPRSSVGPAPGASQTRRSSPASVASRPPAVKRRRITASPWPTRRDDSP